MAGLLKISEATTLALHALLLLAYGAPRKFSARAMAVTMRVSEAHLAKVLQRLAKNGFVRSSRGPGGGFVLTAPATRQPLLKVCEAIEGPLTPQTCLLPHSLCGGTACCALDGLIQRVNREVYDYLTGTTLANVMTGRQRRKAHAPKRGTLGGPFRRKGHGKNDGIGASTRSSPAQRNRVKQTQEERS